MKRFGIVVFLLVLTMAMSVSAYPLNPAVKVCNSNYRFDRIDCVQEYLSCKVDYFECLAMLSAPVMAANCHGQRLACMQDYRGCRNDAWMERELCREAATLYVP